MFFKKRIEELEETVRRLEKHVREILCEHKARVFYEYREASGGLWVEVCCNCRKEMKVFHSHIDCLKAKNKYMESTIALTKAAIAEGEQK